MNRRTLLRIAEWLVKALCLVVVVAIIGGWARWWKMPPWVDIAMLVVVSYQLLSGRITKTGREGTQ